MASSLKMVGQPQSSKDKVNELIVCFVFDSCHSQLTEGKGQSATRQQGDGQGRTHESEALVSLLSLCFTDSANRMSCFTFGDHNLPSGPSEKPPLLIDNQN